MSQDHYKKLNQQVDKAKELIAKKKNEEILLQNHHKKLDKLIEEAEKLIANKKYEEGVLAYLDINKTHELFINGCDPETAKRIKFNPICRTKFLLMQLTSS